MFKGEKCEICGEPATHYLFASFVCDCEECIEKARGQRGGPGGHQKMKMLNLSKTECKR